MSKIFRAKFRDEMSKSELFTQIPSEVWNQAVNCQAAGNSENSVKDLAPYVFKVAISNSRIIKVEDGEVFFKYRKKPQQPLADHGIKCHRVYQTFPSARFANRVDENPLLRFSALKRFGPVGKGLGLDRDGLRV